MKKLYSVITLIVLSIAGWSQIETRNDLRLLLGGSFVSKRTTAAGVPIDFGASIAFSANYADNIKAGNTSLWIEFPFVAEPSNKVQSADLNSIVSLATIFVVPSLRVKFASNAGISPWFSGGFGYGIWEGSEFFGNSTRNNSRYQSTGAVQFGAGLDVRTPIRVFRDQPARGSSRLLFGQQSHVWNAGSRRRAAQPGCFGRYGSALLSN